VENLTESLVLLFLLALVGSVLAWRYGLGKGRFVGELDAPDSRVSATASRKIREGRIHKIVTEARMAEIYRLSDDPRLLELAGLNNREFVFAELMADGFSLYAIEQHLKIAGGAAMQYKRRVLNKLGIRRQEEVAATWNRLKADALGARLE